MFLKWRSVVWKTLYSKPFSSAAPFVFIKTSRLRTSSFLPFSRLPCGHPAAETVRPATSVWDTPAYTNYNISPVYQNAPTLIFLFAEGNSAMDGGIMTENICIAAKSMGLGTCIIASVGGLMNEPEGDIWKERLHVPADWKFLIAIAVGVPDEDPAPKPRAEGRVEIFKEIEL